MERFFATYSGIVVNTSDPAKLGRIQARVPLVYGPLNAGQFGAVADEDLPWADPSGLPLGGSPQSGGVSWLPNAGDRVYVRFLDGEPEKPIWEWAMQDLPEESSWNPHVYQNNNSQGQLAETTTGDTRTGVTSSGTTAAPIPNPIATTDTSSQPLARVTYYAAYEDPVNGTLTATGVTATQGTTVAVDPSLIPYGSTVSIPGLADTSVGSGMFLAQDTGSAVKAQTASAGTAPVIDVYVNAANAADFNQQVAGIEASLQQQYPGYNGYLPYSVTTPQGTTGTVSEASLNSPAFGANASQGLTVNGTTQTGTSQPPARRSALSRYGHVLEFSPIAITLTTATGYYLVLQDGGTEDYLSGVMYWGTPSGYYLELDNEAQTLQTYVPHLQYITTTIRHVNSQDIYVDTMDWSVIAKKQVYLQAKTDMTLEASGKIIASADSDMDLVSKTNVLVEAKTQATISAPRITLGGSGGNPNAVVRQTDLQYVINQLNAYLQTHIHSNGNMGLPTGVPIVPPPTLNAPGSTVIFETTGSPANVQLAAAPVVPPIPVA